MNWCLASRTENVLSFTNRRETSLTKHASNGNVESKKKTLELVLSSLWIPLNLKNNLILLIIHLTTLMFLNYLIDPFVSFTHHVTKIISDLARRHFSKR